MTGVPQMDSAEFAELILQRREMPVDLSSSPPRPVLVTGAAGFIGSALCEFISRRGAPVIALDYAESALVALERDFARRKADLAIELADVRDRAATESVFQKYRPATVFHTAALKHVSLLERFPFEAFATNALGTLYAAQAAEQAGTQRFVLVSTDKAADPISLLGASKRAAERFVLPQKHSNCRRMAVRLSNVFGSTESVVPFFFERIERSEPVTVRDPRAERLFITIREAVSALCVAPEVEGGTLMAYAPGTPLRIVELATRMMSVLGTVEIVFDQLQPGEKAVESLASQTESLRNTCVPGLFTIEGLEGDAIPAELVRELERSCRERDADALWEIVRELVPEYRGTMPYLGESVTTCQRARRAG